MPNEVPARIVRRTMKDSILAVIVWSVFGAVSTGPLFAGGLLTLALQLSDRQIAWVLAFAQLFLPMQMLGAYIQQRWFNRKRFWIFWVSLYYGIFAVIVLLVWQWAQIPTELAVAFFIVFYALAQIAAQMVGSIYVAWLGDLVPARESSGFWSRRQGWSLLATVVVGVAMGALVDWLGRDRTSTYALALALGVAGGFMSLVVQLRIPNPQPEAGVSPQLGEVVRVLLRNRKFVLLAGFFALQTFVGTLSCTYQFPYLAAPVEKGGVGLPMTELQILMAGANLVGFLSSYLFGVVGGKYGRKPVLMICSALKALEFVLWGFIFYHPRNNMLWAAPVFLISGFINMGLVSGQFSLITGVTDSRVRGIAVGLFFALLGLSGFCGVQAAGWIYPLLEPVTLGGFTFMPFNQLCFVAVVGYAASVLVILPFREEGAAQTVRVVRALFANSPVRSVYQPFILSRPMDEDERVSTLLRADGNLSGAEMAHDFYNPSSRVRQSAMLTVLREAEALDAESKAELEKELIRVLTMPELGMQALAARALGVMRSINAVPELLRWIDAQDVALAQACVFAIGMTESPAAEAELVRILANERHRVLWPVAAESLSKLPQSNHVRMVYRAYAEEASGIIREQYLLALARMVMPDFRKAHPLFEREERTPGEGVEKLLKSITATEFFRNSADGMTLSGLLEGIEAGRDPVVVARLLQLLLARYEITPDEGQALKEFLSNRFLPGGQLREEIFNQDNFTSTSLWLAMRLWAEITYDKERHGRYLLLTALTAVRTAI